MTKCATIFVHEKSAGVLCETIYKKHFILTYNPDYEGPPISLTLPPTQKIYEFDGFPSFFDGLLPEGNQLEALLKTKKIDRDDFFSQLLAVGDDLVGAVTVKEKES